MGTLDPALRSSRKEFSEIINCDMLNCSAYYCVQVWVKKDGTLRKTYVLSWQSLVQDTTLTYHQSK